MQTLPKSKIVSLIKVLILAAASLSIQSGCSKAKFEKSPNPHCESDTGACSFDETIFVSGGMVDVLFVNDNSGSMSFEQSKMGERFPTLLQKLDDRMLDYRIGITTTDIETSNNPPRAINQNGALQNGKLISFSGGYKFLEPNTANKTNLFLETMKRPETLECEQYITTSMVAGLSQVSKEYQDGYFNHCPSGDERGVMAALKATRDNVDQFVRKEAHLAVVIVSDENERSWGLTDAKSPYALDHGDQPQVLVDTLKQLYPEKSLSVHSVVVKSGDNSCLNTQNAQMNGLVNGQFGTVYEQLSNLTQGIIGTVCDSDYGTQMGKIGAAIVEQVEYFALHCENPVGLEVIFDPSSATTGYRIAGRRILFDRDLDPSSKVRFKYQCPIVE